MVSVKKHWVLLQPHWVYWELWLCHLSHPWQEIVLISDDIHSGQPQDQKGFLQAEHKPQKKVWPPFCYLEETKGHLGHYLFYIFQIWTLKSALCVIYLS